MLQADAISVLCLVLFLIGFAGLAFVQEQQQPRILSLPEIPDQPENARITVQGIAAQTAYSARGTTVELSDSGYSVKARAEQLLEIDENQKIEITGKIRKNKNQNEIEILFVRPLD